MLQRHVLVAHLAGQVNGLLEHVVGFAAEIWFAARDLGRLAHLPLHRAGDEVGVDVEFLEEVFDHVLPAVHHAHEEVWRLDLLLAVALHEVNGVLHGLL